MLTLKLNLSKLDKARFFKGAKGTYADLVVIPLREPDKYGNTHLVKQSMTKEERQAGVEMPIIGNAQERGKGQASGGRAPKPTGAAALAEAESDGFNPPF